MRYPRGRIADDAVEAVSRTTLSVRTARGLARVWEAEMRTLRPRYRLARLPDGHPWLRQAQRFVLACEADGVDPARVVAALFDHARVQRRRGRAWVPWVNAAWSARSREIYAAWENLQRGKAGDAPPARIAAARRLAEARRSAPELPPPNPPAPVRVAAPESRSLEARLGRALAADGEAYVELARRYPRAEPWAIVDGHPRAFSAAFRVLAAAPLDGDGEDRLARLASEDPERWRAHASDLGARFDT